MHHVYYFCILQDHGLLGCSNHGLLTGGLNVPHLIALQHSPQQQQQQPSQQHQHTADSTATATATTAVALHRETSVVAEDTTTDSSSISTSSSVKASIVACGGWHTAVVDM
jgi:hypothetical protein